MTMSIELPTELQAFVTAQVEAGRCASEQDLVVQLVTLARQSGYMELRDERVAFFVRQLPMGKHNLTHRLRAEIPGRFSALPARAFAMYAPELKGNSDETKLVIRD